MVILARQLAEGVALELERLRGDAEVLGGLVRRDRSSRSRAALSCGCSSVEVDVSILSLRVIQDGAERHRMKARTPAATIATNAITYSTTRMERSSTSKSVVAAGASPIIDVTPVGSSG